MLRALCDTAPRNQMRPLGLLLHSLLAQYGGPAAGWLASSLRSSELQGAPEITALLTATLCGYPVCLIEFLDVGLILTSYRPCRGNHTIGTSPHSQTYFSDRWWGSARCHLVPLVMNSILRLEPPGPYWAVKAISDCVEGAGVMGHQMTEDDCSRFYSIATRTPPLPPMRFSALVIDFANIARGEATGDMLLSYEL